jgi:hypothetical protein
MTDELIFYTHPMSRGRIVRWMLEEIGQPSGCWGKSASPIERSCSNTAPR